jgi:hypothetical protein
VITHFYTQGSMPYHLQFNINDIHIPFWGKSSPSPESILSDLGGIPLLLSPPPLQNTPEKRFSTRFFLKFECFNAR